MTPMRTHLDAEVKFSNGAVSLAAEERQKIGDAVEQARSNDWCGGITALVLGQRTLADRSLPFEQSRAHERVEYVMKLLTLFGAPVNALYQKGGADLEPVPNSDEGIVLIEIEGAESFAGCPIPRDANGFRSN